MHRISSFISVLQHLPFLGRDFHSILTHRTAVFTHISFMSFSSGQDFPSNYVTFLGALFVLGLIHSSSIYLIELLSPVQVSYCFSMSFRWLAHNSTRFHLFQQIHSFYAVNRFRSLRGYSNYIQSGFKPDPEKILSTVWINQSQLQIVYRIDINHFECPSTFQSIRFAPVSFKSQWHYLQNPVNELHQLAGSLLMPKFYIIRAKASQECYKTT